jgi:competence protein ComEC
LSLSFVVGVYVAQYSTSFSNGAWLGAVAFGIIVALQKKTKIAVVVMVAAGLCLGLWRGGNQLIAMQSLQQFIGQEVQLWGKVKDDPTLDIDGDTKMRLTALVYGDKELAGEVWVFVASKNEVKRSDNVLVEGEMSEGFGTIPAAMYRARLLEVQDGAAADPGRQARDTLSKGIHVAISEPESSLGAGFLLGEKSSLPEKLENDLRLLGLTHIIVASGYNLTILVRFARRFFVRISRFTALAVSSGLVLGFVQITGFSPSMSRASIIALLSLFAWYFGRKIHPLVLLPFSAAATVAINPSFAWGDIGWLLSFMAFVGVIILGPLLQAYFWGDRKPNAIRQITVETLSAQICTLPIIIYVFGAYSPLSPLANVLILPLIPVAMLLTAIASVGGILFVPIAWLFGFPAEWLLRYMTTVADRLAQVPYANAEVTITSATVLAMYVGLIGIMVYLWRRTGYALRDSNIVE